MPFATEEYSLFADHRREVELRFSRIEGQLASIAALAAQAQSQIAQHTAVCEERQRLSEKRRMDRDNWDRDRQAEFRQFMEESRADRQHIREQVRDWAVKCLVAGGLGTLSIIGVFISSGALNLLGHH